MLIKSRDDLEPSFASLRALLTRPDVDGRTRGRIETEIRTMSAGRKTEEDAGYQIDFWIRNENLMVIHDLRLEHRGRVAQVDHLIINRFLEIVVCESKSFKEGVAINEHGEWTAFRGGRAYGIPSPIAQNERHIAVLKEIFADGVIPLPKRLGRTIAPELKGIVLVSNSARISRPNGVAAARIQGLDAVIKVEQLHERYNRAFDERDGGQLVASLAFRLVSADAVERFARELAALHKPIAFDWAAKFGIGPITQPQGPVAATAIAAPAGVPTAPPVVSNVAADAVSVCASCAVAVSAAAVTYCQVHASRFGGQILCYSCQRRRGPWRSRNESLEKV